MYIIEYNEAHFIKNYHTIIIHCTFDTDLKSSQIYDKIRLFLNKIKVDTKYDTLAYNEWNLCSIINFVNLLNINYGSKFKFISNVDNLCEIFCKYELGLWPRNNTLTQIVQSLEILGYVTYVD